MITKLELMPEYLCCPIWLINEDGLLIGDGYPEEVLRDESLKRKFDELQAMYDTRFIDTPHVFEHRGFRSEAEKELFIRKWKAAVAELTEKTHGRYEIVDKLKDYHVSLDPDGRELTKRSP